MTYRTEGVYYSTLLIS